MLPGYMKGIEAVGGIPVMLPLTEDEKIIQTLVGQFDGFLLTGGQDVAPALYGEAVSDKCGEPCPERDAMETVLLKYALEADKPILGICRGIQFLNVYFGGTLYQDLPAEYTSDTEHHMTPPYDRAVHCVRLTAGSPLHALLEKDILGVNSYHHQAIRCLAPELLPMAYSEDGLAESVYLPDKRFVWAVQWHPELSYQKDGNSKKILHAFVSEAAKPQ